MPGCPAVWWGRGVGSRGQEVGKLWEVALDQTWVLKDVDGHRPPSCQWP